MRKTEQICRFWCESDIFGHSDIKRPGRPFFLEFYGYESGLEHFRLDRTQGKDADSITCLDHSANAVKAAHLITHFEQFPGASRSIRYPSKQRAALIQRYKIEVQRVGKCDLRLGCQRMILRDKQHQAVPFIGALL